MAARFLTFCFPGLVALAFTLCAACGDDGDNGEPAAPTPSPSAEPTRAPFPGEVQLTDADNAATVELGDGGKLIVALAGNPTTGFSWSVSEQSDPQLELQGEPAFVPAGSTSPIVGAGGTEVFTFEAVDVGFRR